MKNTYVIEGVLTALTPLHISAAHTSQRITDEGKIVFGSNGTAMTVQMKMPIPAAAYFDERDGEEYTVIPKIPYAPANTLRGMIRRTVAQVIFEEAIKRGVTLDLPVYQGLSCGTSTSAPNTAGRTVELMSKARDDVYLGLMGGSPLMVNSCLRAFDAVPICDATMEQGMIPDHMADHVMPGIQPKHLTYPVHFIRKDDSIEMQDPLAEHVITEYDRSVGEWLQNLADNQSNRKDARDAKKKAKDEGGEAVKDVKAKNLKQIMSVEVVPATTRLYVRFEVFGENKEAQMGMLLKGLNSWAKKGFFGGGNRKGMGRFALNLDMSYEDELLGTILTSGWDGVTFNESIAEKEMTACEKAVSEYDMGLLNRFFEIPA